MPVECVIALADVRVVPQSFAIELAARLGPDRMRAVCRALAVATGCS